MRRPMLRVPTGSFCCGMLSAFADGARRSISPVCVRVARGTFRSAFRVRHCCRFFVIVSSSRSLIFLPFRSLINAALQKMSIFENAALVRGRAPVYPRTPISKEHIGEDDFGHRFDDGYYPRTQARVVPPFDGYVAVEIGAAFFAHRFLCK